MFGTFGQALRNSSVGHGKHAAVDTDCQSKDDDAHRVFNLITRGILPIYIILDLDDKIAVISQVWFTRNFALDFFPLLRERWDQGMDLQT